MIRPLNPAQIAKVRALLADHGPGARYYAPTKPSAVQLSLDTRQ